MHDILTSPGAPTTLSPDRTVFHPLDVLKDSLVHLCTTPIVTPYNDRETVRLPFVADYEPAGFVAEGEKLPGGDFSTDEVTVKSRKIAQSNSLSNELLDTPENGVENILTTTMINSLVAKANTAFLTNVEEPTGLNTLTGRTDVGALADNLDPFTDAFATLEDEGADLNNMWIIAHPLDWAALAKLKDATGSNRALLTPTEPGTRNIDGIPVHTSRFAQRGTITIGDRGNVPAAYSEIHVESDKSVLFEYDSVMFRSKYRVGWNVMNAARIATLTVEP